MTTTQKTESDKSNASSISKKIKNFGELKEEYELVEENLTLKGILRKMGETLEYDIKILVQVLQPEEFHALHECAAFDDAEKAKVFTLFKTMMILHREIVKAELEGGEKNIISTIQLAHTEMKGYKKDLINIIQKMQDSWKKITIKDNIRYFG